MDFHNSKLKINNSKQTVVPIKKWLAKMNVRAVYSEDGRFYEAVIERFLDNNSAVVRFHGYDNEEIVSVSSLQPSLGKNAIKEQIEISQTDKISTNEERIGDHEITCEDVNWKIGMACRALYEKNDVIYEGTVKKIDDSERTASVAMTGYGVVFEAKFENMYESIPEYRVKQEISAKNYIKEQAGSSNKAFLAPPDRESQSKKSNSNSTDRETDAITPRQFKDSEFNKTQCESTDVFLENHSLVQFSTEGILQPKNESEALACLISANYLSGYYAGYYDCLRQRHIVYES